MTTDAKGRGYRSFDEWWSRQGLTFSKPEETEAAKLLCASAWRTALAQPRPEQVEDEAVAWQTQGSDGKWFDACGMHETLRQRGFPVRPLYARPAPKPAWGVVELERLRSAERELHATVRKLNCDNAEQFWSAIAKLRAASPAPANAAPAPHPTGERSR